MAEVIGERIKAVGASIREVSPRGVLRQRWVEEIVYLPATTEVNLDLHRIDFGGADISYRGIAPSGYGGQLEKLVSITGDENAVSRMEVSFFNVPPQNRIEIR